MPDRSSYQVSSSFDKMSINKSNRLLDFLKRRWWIVLGAVVILAVLGFFAFNYLDTRNKLVQLQGSGNSEAQQIVSEVSKYIELPQEEPTLATISDASQLQSQEFFKNAKDDDKVLIFSASGRALLYRPSTHKIIEYSKVDLGTAQPQQSSNSTQP